MEGGADPDFFNSNGIWRGYKRDLYEGGIRVPMIISWAGRVQPVLKPIHVFVLGCNATFREILNPKAKNQQMDGVSLLPLLENRKGRKNMNICTLNFRR